MLYPAAIFLLAFTPGIFWLWFFTRKDIYRPKPKWLLASTFLLGMVATLPAAIIEFLFLDDSITEPDSLASLATIASGMLFIVGPVEETCKFLTVRMLAYRSLHFDQPGDGLIYSASASLGFASLENLFYVLAFGPAVMIARAPISTLAHVVFGSFWGYALGNQVQKQEAEPWMVPTSVGIAALLHGLFNIAAFTLWPAAIIITMLGAAWTLRQFVWARRVSPFRYRRNYPRVLCPSCGQLISIISQYCRLCGAPITLSYKHEITFCSNCNHQNPPSAGYCSSCGDQLLHRYIG